MRLFHLAAHSGHKIVMFGLFSLLFTLTFSLNIQAKEAIYPSPDSGSGALETATFAGGCFWCTEADLEKILGVKKAVSGFSGGQIKNPSYQAVASGKTQHIEAVQITYNPKQVTYEKILAAYWKHIDPTDSKGQFVDRGPQYRPIIFYHTPNQKAAAIASKKYLTDSKRFEKPITTEIQEYQLFWPAEEYHQDYYKKNPIRYKYYRHRSGRDQFIRKYWEKPLTQNIDESSKVLKQKYFKPSHQVIKNQLTNLQYQITQKNGTEPAFKNEFWDNKKAGIYVDIVSSEPLFSSLDKFKSGTGWPSFSKPLVNQHLVEKLDFSFIFPRTEIRSKYGDSHLGHLFKDGPEPTGLRYCINSAALKFIEKDQLVSAGYGEFSYLFSP